MPTSLVFAGQLPASTLSQRTAAGALVRLAPGVYTTDTTDPEGVVAREWRAIEPRWRHLPFFEAYFSNYIEGTEFELAEAARVI